jgi:hypothetical protein
MDPTEARYKGIDIAEMLCKKHKLTNRNAISIIDEPIIQMLILGVSIEDATSIADQLVEGTLHAF